MKRAISYCINQALRQKQSVHLKDIGSLKLLSHHKKRQKKLALIPKRSSNKSLIKQIQREYQLNEKTTKKILNAYNKIILRKLDKYSLVTIPTVAIISKSTKGNTFIKSLITEKPYLKSQKKSSKNKEKKKRTNTTTAAFITPISVKEEKLVHPKSKIAEVNKTDTKKIIESEPDIDQELLNEIAELEQLNTSVPQKDELKEILKDHFYQEDIEEVDSDPVNERDRHLSNTVSSENVAAQYTTQQKPINYKPWIISALSLLTFALLVFMISRFFIQPETSELLESNSEEVLGVDRTIENDEYEDPPEVLSEATAPNAEAQKCIIITGSFSNAENESQMKNLILSNGYTPYSESYNGLTRVGIEIDCTDQDTDGLLNDVRKNINNKAWYLFPPDGSI